MVTKTRLNHLKQLSNKQPLLSLYLDVNPSKADTREDAPLIRVKDSLRQLELPKSFVQDVLSQVKSELIRRRARSLVLFSNEDSSFSEFMHLQLELPELKDKAIVVAWGKALTAPLTRLTDSASRYALVYVDEARWRYFELFFDDIAEVQDAFRPLSTHNWRDLSESHVGVAQGVIARGGIAKDKVQQRESVWTERFFKQAAALLEEALSNHSIEQLILMGSSRHLSEFKAVLSPSTQKAIISSVSPPANPNASANDLAKLIKPCIAKHTKSKELELIINAQENGVVGLAQSLKALQKGQLSQLIAPWEANPSVYVTPTTNYVTATMEETDPSDVPKLEHLHSVLDDLTDKYATELSYVRGEAEQQLMTLDGLAGLRRW